MQHTRQRSAWPPMQPSYSQVRACERERVLMMYIGRARRECAESLLTMSPACRSTLAPQTQTQQLPDATNDSNGTYTRPDRLHRHGDPVCCVHANLPASPRSLPTKTIPTHRHPHARRRARTWRADENFKPATVALFCALTVTPLALWLGVGALSTTGETELVTMRQSVGIGLQCR